MAKQIKTLNESSLEKAVINGPAKLTGFGETDDDGTDADYSSLPGIALIPKAYMEEVVEDIINDKIYESMNITTQQLVTGTYANNDDRKMLSFYNNSGSIASVALNAGFPIEIPDLGHWSINGHSGEFTIVGTLVVASNITETEVV